MALLNALVGCLIAQEASMDPIVVRNDYAKLLIGADARGVKLIDVQSGTDYGEEAGETAFAAARAVRASRAGTGRCTTGAFSGESSIHFSS